MAQSKVVSSKPSHLTAEIFGRAEENGRSAGSTARRRIGVERLRPCLFDRELRLDMRARPKREPVSRGCAKAQGRAQRVRDGFCAGARAPASTRRHRRHRAAQEPFPPPRPRPRRSSAPPSPALRARARQAIQAAPEARPRRRRRAARPDDRGSPHEVRTSALQRRLRDGGVDLPRHGAPVHRRR